MDQIYYNLLPFNIEGTTLIPLSQGYWTLVDSEFALIAPKCHVKKGKKTDVIYAMYHIKIDNRETKQYLHQLVLEYYKIKAPEEIDHINRNGLDNRLCNLRAVTSGQNKCNVGLRSSNTSGYKGVNWHKASNKWLVQIRINGQKVYLGLFDDIIEAARAYDLASISH